ncbi:uncharacterized protein CANTADRAFT_27348 [Suhomyces tanzawaensis NRRL Y-17324]|uniref:Uncharacterized protein n=1 Tax=Suhomyces tanzawaensis NRRL Y-17324 TaxID=984487 RepID=A0A1E4SDN2_9ASCO|nr:uncharacterized protein CANTADRAFT_27348 [Suhomyces tanzawaensis NRRL Y-17324]ODV77624.1 hypothetical protein CANTADRAFT_27348 [Suhomyces tanzawaensis NRRL Y-17324]
MGHVGLAHHHAMVPTDPWSAGSHPLRYRVPTCTTTIATHQDLPPSNQPRLGLTQSTTPFVNWSHPACDSYIRVATHPNTSSHK